MYLKVHDDRSVDEIQANISCFRNKLQQKVIEFRTQSTSRIKLKKDIHLEELNKYRQFQRERGQNKLLRQKKQQFSTALPKPRFFVNPNTMLCKHKPFINEKDLIEATSTEKFTNSKHLWKYTPTKMDYLTNIFGYRLSAPNKSKRSTPIAKVVPLTTIGVKLVNLSEDKYMSLVNEDAQVNRNKYSGLYKRQGIDERKQGEPKVWNKTKLIGGAFSDYKYESQKFLDWRERDRVINVRKPAEHKLWKPVKICPTYF